MLALVFKYRCGEIANLAESGFVISNSEKFIKTFNKIKFSDIMRDFKKFTAMHLIKTIKESPNESRKLWLLNAMQKAGKKNINNTNYQLWQQHNHPIHIEGEVIDQKLDYIHYNPVKAGWVLEPYEFYYSSARNYTEMESPLTVTSVFDGALI